LVVEDEAKMAELLSGGSAGERHAVDVAGHGEVSTRLRVNPIACDAHGLCAEPFPERLEGQFHLRRYGAPAGSRAHTPL
jgi:hypothetical protein